MNNALLWGLLHKHKYSVAKLAKHLDISTTSVYRKLDGKSEFNRREISIIRIVFNLTYGELVDIFFNEKGLTL